MTVKILIKRGKYDTKFIFNFDFINHLRLVKAILFNSYFMIWNDSIKYVRYNK